MGGLSYTYLEATDVRRLVDVLPHFTALEVLELFDCDLSEVLPQIPALDDSELFDSDLAEEQEQGKLLSLLCRSRSWAPRLRRVNLGKCGLEGAGADWRERLREARPGIELEIWGDIEGGDALMAQIQQIVVES